MKESLRDRGCTHKRRHKTQQSANKHMISLHILNKMLGRPKHNLNTYRCQFCGFFHVGHTAYLEPTHHKETYDVQ